MRDQLPEGWVWTTLDEIGEFLRGVSYSKEDATEQPKDGLVPILRATNIQDENLILDRDLVYVPSKYIKPGQYLKPGDIVVCMSSGSKHLVGKTAILAQEWIGAFGTFCAVIRPSQTISARFLGYYFSSPDYRQFIREKSAGININNLKPSDFSTLDIPLPPLAEQERIVAKIEALFSQLDAGVAALRRIQAALKRYKASVLKAACEGRLVGQDPADEPAEALLRRLGKAPLVDDDLPTLPEGWCWVRVGDVGKVKGGKRLPAGHDYSDEMTAFPYIRVVDFQELSVRSNELKYLKPETQAAIRQYTISKDDVYISIAGSIGKVGLIPEHLDKANLTENAAKITELQAIGNKFLAYILASPISQEQISESTISTTQPKLALFRIEKIQIPIPPLPEQQRIVAEIERCLSVIAEVEAVVAALLARSARLRQAILKQAFSGQL